MNTNSPTVAGRMEMTHEAFRDACSVALLELQEKPNPDNSLVHLLCEAIRCSRECCDLAKRALVVSANSSAAPPFKDMHYSETEMLREANAAAIAREITSRNHINQLQEGLRQLRESMELEETESTNIELITKKILALAEALPGRNRQKIRDMLKGLSRERTQLSRLLALANSRIRTLENQALC